MPTAFPIFTIFMILVIFLAVRYRMINKKTNTTNEEFFDRERQANSTPAKDISNLHYITIPMEKFPINSHSDSEVLAIESHLAELSQKKLLNLTNKTNTDLKLEYGVPNFETMKQIGDDFDDLTTTLVKYATKLIELDDIDSAIKVLEFGAAIKTDIAGNYMLLADCYSARGQFRKIQALYEPVKSLELLRGSSIIRHFDELCKDYHPDDSVTEEPDNENFTV